MRNKFILALCLCFSLTLSKDLLADSPLTSTYFASFYYEYPMVATAETTRALNDDIMAFLASDEQLIDVKAAVINAIGWSYDGTKNAEMFWNYLARKHATTSESLSYALLSAHELFCYGYLMAMDDYFNVANAVEVLKLATTKDNTSYTIHMVLAMTEAQMSMDYDWCGVWKSMRAVLNNTTLKRDIKTAAIQSVVDYMILYKSSCYE